VGSDGSQGEGSSYQEKGGKMNNNEEREVREQYLKGN